MTIKATIDTSKIHSVVLENVSFVYIHNYVIHFNAKRHMIIYSQSQDTWHNHIEIINESYN